MAEALLQLEGIEKSFGPVRALRGVSLRLDRGEVLGLIGENGAGKSTLMNVLAGVYRPDRGGMHLAGQRYAPSSPLEGLRVGIAAIYQELSLAPHLSVEANITLGREARRLGVLRSQHGRVREVLGMLEHADIDTAAAVGDLSIGRQQVVEIARALFADARIVVMDEPTSALSARDARTLFQVVGRLRDRGVAFIFVSHFLEEVRRLCDRFAVLRDGRAVANGSVEAVTDHELIRHMVGRDVGELYPQSRHRLGDVFVRVGDLSGREGMPAGANINLRRGEILGLAGLVGAGRSETLRALFGLNPTVSGRLAIAGKPELRVRQLTPYSALEQGVDMLSEDRQVEGLALGLSISANITLSGLRRYRRWGLLDRQRERDSAVDWGRRLGIKAHDPDAPVATLSGGNQQRVCLARLLHQDGDVLLMDEPTRGIDIATKAHIYRLMHALAESGKAILMTSSYLPELFGVCDTLAVVHRGVVSESRPVEGWTLEKVMQFATSGIGGPPLRSIGPSTA